MRIVLAAALAIVMLFVAPCAQAGEERIIRFLSDVSIGNDGVLTVTETITVEAAGISIRHGIFRDFPTVSRTANGVRKHVTFHIVSVTLDGQPVRYALESIPNGRRTKIGDADLYVSPGVHTYALTYRTGRQLGFFPEFDELNWNVTGNFWNFTIESAEALIHVPPAARIQQFAFYTGSLGATEKDATAEKLDATTLRVRTTRPLYGGEGLTVAVGFTKGVVAAPGAMQQSLQWLRDNATTMSAALGLLALLGYYAVTWFRFGRDPDPGTIVPLFSAPPDFSPAAVRYVNRMAFDQKTFSAALVSMAVKGYLRITESGGDYTLHRTGKSEGECRLDAGENAVAAALFAGRSGISLKQVNHSTISRAISALSAALARECQPRYFVTNRIWFFAGLAFALVSALGAVAFSDTPDVMVPVAMSIGLVVGGGFFAGGLAARWKGAVAAPGFLGGRLISALFTSVFALVFVSGFAISLFAGARESGLLPASILFSVQGLVALVFYHLLKAPTAEGAKARGDIAGLRMYLDTAEKERLEMLHPPQLTPEVFERFLPFAIALDAENSWSRRFEAEAREAGIAPTQSSYSPGWYSGSRSFASIGSAGLASTLGATVASAATSPSSGGGGGGSSGGGGGGGGGGGW